MILSLIMTDGFWIIWFIHLIFGFMFTDIEFEFLLLTIECGF